MKDIIHNGDSIGELYTTFIGYKIYHIVKDCRNPFEHPPIFACCHIPSGIIMIFDEFLDLSEECKTIILLHEIAHIRLNTNDENQADQFAIEHMQNGEYWMKTMRALTNKMIPDIKENLIKNKKYN